jgi:bla regulator protein BlaR1
MIGELTNHLWQSTLFVVAAGLLAIACRKNRAQIRYWLWLSASLKFLVPFSLLVSLGSHLEWVPTSKKIATQAVSFTVVQITQPFSATLSFATSAPRTTNWVPIAILGLWLCGFGVIALVRFKAWLRIRAAVRSSTSLKMPAKVEVRSSPGLLEPGVVGLLRPVLLLPAGIVERLTKPQLEALLTHELCHIRRRDNLTAAIHMIVEALFWFHPLVWWIGARLVEERERACDEDVLRLGTEAQVYAEGILRVCEFYVESPLSCVAGVTGNNLKKRMGLIMRNHVGEALNVWRKLLLATAGIVVVAAPIVFGLLHLTETRTAAAGQASAIYHAPIPEWRPQAGSKQEFEVVSVKQNKSDIDASMNVDAKGGSISGSNVRLISYIYFAYNVTGNQLQLLMPQLPKWVVDDRFDIQARADSNPTRDQMRLMLRHLLSDRFKLAMHYETRQLPVFALALATPGKLGPHIQPHRNDSSCAISSADPHSAPTQPATVAGDGFPTVCDSIEGLPSGPTGRLRVGARRVSLGLLATTLAQMGNLYRPVLDQTGLSGTFDFTFEWTPQFNGPGTPGANSQVNESGPTFLDDLQQQLGLKLEPQVGTTEVLVFDHAEQPAEPQAQYSQTATFQQQVASIKLNKVGTASLKTGEGIIRQRLMFQLGAFTGENVSLHDMIRAAYRVEDYQISGASPDWFTSELYNVDAKAGKSAVDEMQKLGKDQRDLENQRMLQALLKGRFKLALNRETKDLQIYSLVVAEVGKLHEAQGDCDPAQPPWKPGMPPPPPPCGSLRVFNWVGRMDGLKVPIAQLVDNLSARTRRMVLDKTNLLGKYDINLQWFPDPSEFGPRPAYLPPTYQPDPNSPPLLTAIQQQLGLKLESQTAPVDLLVIDHAEKPSEN